MQMPQHLLGTLTIGRGSTHFGKALKITPTAAIALAGELEEDVHITVTFE
jgi:hypothetical protein